MTQRALLLIDLQNDYFPGGSFELPGMEPAAKNVSALLTWARKKGLKIIYIRHEDNEPDAEFFLSGSVGAEINGEVAPSERDPIVTKTYPNSFRETNLEKILGGIEELILVGAMSNMCIDATARAACDLGYGVTIVHDACAACGLVFKGCDISADVVHGAFMAALASAYGSVVSTEDLLAGV